MYTTNVTALEERHSISVFLNDKNNHQHELNAKLVISYKRGRYELKLSSVPSEVLESVEYNDAFKSLKDRAREVGTQLLADFRARTGPKGNQLSLFDSLPESSSDEDQDEQGEN